MSKKILKIASVIIGSLVALSLAFYLGRITMELEILRQGPSGLNQGSQNTQPVPQLKVSDIAPITSDEHILGNLEATIALIEYSDFECPFCQMFHYDAKQLIQDNPNLMWVYRHLPLEQLHPNARGAAIASECVAKLAGNEAFWIFADGLFSAGDIEEETVNTIATSLGYNISGCITDPSISELVEADISSATKVGITGTPGNILINLETGESYLVSGARTDLVQQTINKLQ